MNSQEELPLVSVITPTLDPGDRLQRCIESVRAQTYPRIEHVVVDGGSKDGTVGFLEESAGLVWISETDSGQASAINKGFRLATGSILGWLNADDRLTPEAVDLVVDALRREPAVGWVFGDVEIIDGTTRELAHPAPIDKPLRWAARNLAAQPGSFHPRWALELVDYLDESFHYMMDCDLWLRMIGRGVQTKYIPRTLAIFEVHEASKTGSVSHAEFVKEEARARLNSGLDRSAAVAFGRAAAWVAFRSGCHDELALQEEIEAIMDSLPDRSRVRLEIVRAGAKAERAILEVKRNRLRGLRHLFAPAAWRYPETRARLRDAATREIARLSPRIRQFLPDQ
jgi:GT2 family glycosyltransferase